MKSEDSARRNTSDDVTFDQEMLLNGWRLLTDPTQFHRFIQRLKQAPEHQLPETVDFFAALSAALKAAQDHVPPLAKLLQALTADGPDLGLLYEHLLKADANAETQGLYAALGLSKLGPLYQRQQKLDRASRAAQEYIAAQQEYAVLLQDLAQALSAAGEHGLSSAPSGCGPRALYDSWLEQVEPAYERFIHSERYSKAFGRMCNASATLIAHTRQSLEGLLRLLDVPTRQDLESTQRRLHELWRQQQTLAEAVDRQELARLRSELEQMRTELNELKQSKPVRPRHSNGRVERTQ